MKILVKRVLSLALIGCLQAIVIILFLTVLEPFIIPIDVVLAILSLIVVLYMISKRDEPAYNILWLVIVLILPIVGIVLYLIFGEKRRGKPITIRLESAEKLMTAPSEGICGQDRGTLSIRHERLYNSLNVIEKKSGYNICTNEHTEYFPLGDDMYVRILEELKKAKKFIYCEYFIINHGLMWDQMEEIMIEKAAEGVDVRVLYDDLGSIGTFSPEESKRLALHNIKCERFNPIFYLSGTLNYRDHRKMLIIDGISAFSGGINLADEYINHITRFGHWKDIGFHITGPAVVSYTHMFIKFWNAYSEDKITSPIDPVMHSDKHDGYILSYYDSPLENNNLSYYFYIDLLYQAKKYIWFYAPYLIPGSYLVQAFESAAKRGVDVRIITPGIPDKAIIFRMTRSYYLSLLEAGVRIYEYTPGFIHAKGCIMDDEVAAVGTVNLDYRSLFLHYENNSVFIESDVIKEIKADFIDTMDKSKEQKIEQYNSRNFFSLLADAFLRIFSPLC